MLPRPSLEQLLGPPRGGACLNRHSATASTCEFVDLQEGYDLGDLPGEAGSLEGLGEAIVTALKMQDDQRAITGWCTYSVGTCLASRFVVFW